LIKEIAKLLQLMPHHAAKVKQYGGQYLDKLRNSSENDKKRFQQHVWIRARVRVLQQVLSSKSVTCWCNKRCFLDLNDLSSTINNYHASEKAQFLARYIDL
jgi:hypothetical protein